VTTPTNEEQCVGIEIERKFLVHGTPWQAWDAGTAVHLRQGYLCSGSAAVVRVRSMGVRAVLTIKGEQVGATRAEYEYPIPLEDAREMLDQLCQDSVVEKTRYRVQHEGVPWVVDVFDGSNAGLVVAEVELEADDQHFSIPAWAGEEVTDEPRYLNVNLSRRPFRQWSDAERCGSRS
jgi:adenylate cyclase